MVLAAEIHTKGMFSDMLRRELTDISVSILPSRRLGFSRGGQFETGREEWLAVHARGEIRRRSRRFVQLAEEYDGTDPPPELLELDAAVTQELGVGLIEIVHFHHELINIGWELDGSQRRCCRGAVYSASCPARMGTRQGRSRDRSHSLRPRDNFFPAAPFSRTDVYPWRFNRELSYIRRPILIRVTETGAEEAVWGTRHVYSAGRHTFELFTGGRMRARTERLNVLLNRWRAADALAFNDQVADLFRTQEKSKVRVRVTRFGRRPIERARGHQISDIDVFVADTERQEILVIETKALAVGRTAAELENERLSTFVAAPGRRSDVEKLLDVVEWVKPISPTCSQAWTSTTMLRVAYSPTICRGGGATHTVHHRRGGTGDRPP